MKDIPVRVSLSSEFISFQAVQHCTRRPVMDIDEGEVIHSGNPLLNDMINNIVTGKAWVDFPGEVRQ